MRYLIFLLLSACIIPTGSMVRTDNPRTGVWVVDGHAWITHVDQPEVVAGQCGGWNGCVKWVPGERRGVLWTIDNLTMAAHECAHALGFSRAMTDAQIQAELNHWPWELFGSWAPAMESPCGTSDIYTGLKNERGGRLLTIEEWQHRGLP